MRELAAKVWDNGAFHAASMSIELHWLKKELDLPSEQIDPALGAKALRAAVILSGSDLAAHRHGAFKIATHAHRLFEGQDKQLSAALRVVLARLGNFPSLTTDSLVSAALVGLPWSIAAEELDARAQQTVSLGGQELVLTRFQHSLWTLLRGSKSVAISAPTSAGKTFVLQNFITSLFDGGSSRNVVYLVPTRALITQVAADLERQFSGSGDAPEIVTVPMDRETEMPGRGLYVLTPERLQVILMSHPDFAASLLVVDEAHSIEDGARGILLQWVIDEMLKRRNDAQILFASPIVRNLDIFGKIFEIPDVRQSASTEPTVGQNFVMIEVESAAKGRIAILSAHDGVGELEEIGNLTLNHTLASKVEKLVHISARFGVGSPNIVYANGPAEAEDIAMQLADVISVSEIDGRRAELSLLAKEVVHEKYVLSETIKSGIAFHYSNIPAMLRKAVEDAFSEGVVNYVVSTSTLLQGVNTPAKNIFMCAPEKGRLKPLESTDFWNLSGRAGRLRKEFQGTIFLIDYSKWKKHPLSGPKDNEIKPALETTILDKTEQLVSMISDPKALRRVRNLDDVESAFSRLLVDAGNNDMGRTLQRLGGSLSGATFSRLENAINEARAVLTIPDEVVRQTPGISAHKQQSLLDELDKIVRDGGAEAAKALLPAHPRESESYSSYCNILERCHETLLGLDTTRGLHRFQALLARKWMLGIPLPQIIDEQIRRNPTTSTRKIIRDTLDSIERTVRFEVVRLFTCYNSILEHVLDKNGITELKEAIASVPIFLEIGASDRTMISFIGLGLSRVTAMKLNAIAARKDMDLPAARQWLRSRNIESLGLSPLLTLELVRVVETMRA